MLELSEGAGTLNQLQLAINYTIHVHVHLRLPSVQYVLDNQNT